MVDLVVPNIAEFNLRHPSLSLDPATRKGFTATGAELADPAALWSTGPRILLLPAGYDEVWLRDLEDGLGLSRSVVVSPAHRSGLVTEDLLLDGAALAVLRRAVDGRDVRILPWGATPQLYQLAATISGWGAGVSVDTVPERDYWVSLYLDSKVSCGDLARDVPGLRVPRTVTVTSAAELEGAVRVTAGGSGRAIVKTPYGAGGEGSLVARSVDAVWSAAHRNPFLRTFPLLVQEYVDQSPEAGCPAVDLLIADEGVRRCIANRIAVDGLRCCATVIGPDSVPPDLARELTGLGERIGAAAHRLGFRGWFCIDFVRGTDGRLYVTEFNARRSGAMGAIVVADRLAPEAVTVQVGDPVPVGGRGPLSYSDIRPAFQRLWADGVRAYPTMTRGLSRPRPWIGLLAVGPDADQAQDATEAVRAALRSAQLAVSGV